jgi:hypothetical protein
MCQCHRHISSKPHSDSHTFTQIDCTLSSLDMSMHSRYQKLPSGSLFPVAETVDDLSTRTMTQLNSSSFSLEASGKMHNIMLIRGPDRSVYTPIPTHYEHLVRRFIWRMDVLKEMFFDLRGPAFSLDQRFGIACNMVYAAEVLAFCRPLFRAATAEREEVRIHFFDTYMLEEHYVGRHEPSAVILWQKEHSQHNLRTDDANGLGM